MLLFSQENDLKRARALKKTEGEREVCRIKDAEIQQLRAEIAELTEIVQRQKKKIQKFSLFQKFMVDVLEWADEVRHVTICMPLLICSLSLSLSLSLSSLTRRGRSLLAMTHSARPERPVYISPTC